MAFYLSNALNEYETYTYNLQLYIVQPTALQDLDAAITSGKALLLADNSQMTKFNITSCDHTFVMGHGKVREAFASQFNMVISEPNGIDLLGTINTLSRRLGVFNHLRAGYILAIEFNGRRSNGLPKKFPQKFYYPLMLPRMDFKVTEGGTIYNLDFIENSAASYQYTSNVILGQITVEAETVGEFIELFTERLNESLDQAWRINPSLSAGIGPDQYAIEFDETTEDWKRWRFEVLDNDFEVNGASFIGRPGQNPKLQVIATSGTNITSLISSVLQLTAEYKNILTHQKGQISNQSHRPAPEEATTLGLDALPVFFKLIGNIEYGEYDELRGEYVRTNKFKIKAYTVTDEIIDAVSYATSINDKSKQLARISNLFSGNFLRKRYDYYFTGRNTEVINLDLQFDQAYYVVTPHGDGYFGDPEVQSPMAAADSESLKARLQNVQVAKQNLARAQRQLDTAINTGNTSILGSLLSGVEVSLGKFQAEVSATLTDLKETNNYNPSEVAYLVRFRGDVISDSDTHGSENNNRSGALKMGAVKTNLENSADLMKIELEIRGDPYWMGRPNSFYNNQRNIEGIADYEAGAPSFFLNVNLPNADEDQFGRRKPRPDYQVTGLYRVVSVISRFQNGQFVQYLEAIRDLATNIPTVYDILAGDNDAIEALESARLTQLGEDISQRIENARSLIGPNR